AFGVVFLIDARLSKPLDQLFFRHDPIPIARLAMIANHLAEPFVDYAPVIRVFSEFKHFAANEALIQIAHSKSPLVIAGDRIGHMRHQSALSPRRGIVFLTTSRVAVGSIKLSPEP